MEVFKKLGIPENPIMLAPLAGVSDHPFRRICSRHGADLTYVEMISATALTYDSPRTLAMLKRHDSETVLGVQITGRTAEDTARAVAILDRHPFDTIDINMGCPVKKVVKTGCGSAILKDPERVYQTVRLAREATSKPLSVKIRIGWDRGSVNAVAVAEAAAAGGAAWITVHGRARSDDYSVPVDLETIAKVKAKVTIPVIGNGNIFTESDGEYMRRVTAVDGVMVSRGALGNPWVFRLLKNDKSPVALTDWLATVESHLDWQAEEYGQRGSGAVCMRKHLLWYAKGWPGARKLRERINDAADLGEARRVVAEFADDLVRQGVQWRADTTGGESETRFHWDPKWEMDRQLDRGVGTEGLA